MIQNKTKKKIPSIGFELGTYDHGNFWQKDVPAQTVKASLDYLCRLLLGLANPSRLMILCSGAYEKVLR